MTAASAAPRDFDPGIETLGREDIRRIQAEGIRWQIPRLIRSAAYADVVDALDPAVGDDELLAAVSRLPLTRKGDIRSAMLAEPPFGGMLSVDVSDVARVHFSSGTTGDPTPMAWTLHDLDAWQRTYARMFWMQGVRRESRCEVGFGYEWFVGGLGATAGLQNIGALVLPAGSRETERQIRAIHRFGVTSFIGTPSFAVHLAEAAIELGMPLDRSTVTRLHLGGEPGVALEGTRDRIEALWGARCLDVYGCLEFQPIAFDCEERGGMHLADDMVFAELVDPATDLPTDADEGVLVLTHLDREAFPLLRFWTGDIVRLDRTPCVCGRTHTRVVGGVIGRADDMFVVRGINLFPSQIEQVIRSISTAGPEFRIIRPSDGTMPRELRLLVEPADHSVDPERLAERIRREIKSQLSILPSIEVLDLGRLERATHKTQRFVTERDRPGKESQ